MRGSRVKALMLSYYQTFGHRPSKTRYAQQRVRPKGLWRRFWWWLTRRVEMETVRYPGTWRRWKKMAQATDREMTPPRDRGLPRNRPNLARRKRRATELHEAKRQFETKRHVLMPWIGGKHYGAKRDHNHKTVERAFRMLGCTVADLSAVGGGMSDLLVGFRGRDHKVEVKNQKTSYGRKGLSQSQKDFARLWNGDPHVDEVWDEEDARILVEQWSKKK